MTIVVLHCKHRGDFNNILGIARAISEKSGSRIQVVDIAVRANLLIPAALRLLRREPHPLRRWAKFFFAGAKSLPLKDVRYVVSTLGKGEPAAIFAARLTGARTVHLGHPKRVPADQFDLIIAHQGHGAQGHELTLPVSPSQIRLADYRPHAEREALLLAVGGATKEFMPPLQFWTMLGVRSAQWAAVRQSKFHFTTSPRTGDRLEKEIVDALRNSGNHASVATIYGRGETSSLAEHLLCAGTVVVSAESVSMISEGIASGAIVVAAYWRELPSAERLREFLLAQHNAGRLALWDLSKMQDPDLANVAPLRSCWSETLWSALSSADWLSHQPSN